MGFVCLQNERSAGLWIHCSTCSMKTRSFQRSWPRCWEKQRRKWRRKALLRKGGLIKAYKALIDWDKVGDAYASALIELKVIPQKETGFDSIAEESYALKRWRASI